MSETDMKEEHHVGLSVNKLSTDLFALIEVKKNLEAYVKEMAKKMTALKTASKTIDKYIIETQSLLANEVRSGSKESAQFTLDCFESLQDRLEDVVYREFQEKAKYDEIMGAVTEIELGYDRDKKAVVINGLIR